MKFKRVYYVSLFKEGHLSDGCRLFSHVQTLLPLSPVKEGQRYCNHTGLSVCLSPHITQKLVFTFELYEHSRWGLSGRCDSRSKLTFQQG